MVGIGQRIHSRLQGRDLVLERLIGEGSQGAVYEAVPDGPSNGRVAVKWYFPHTATDEQRRAIVALVDRGAPSPHFLWPSEMVDIPGDRTFGYIMPLRPERFVGLADLLVGKVDVPFSTICRLCLHLADAFLRLHSQGLCYRDISFSNVFLEAASGQPLICDNDNVGIDGKAHVTVLGTRRFMAPEIVRREAFPSSKTDLYSLAVLLFYMLMTGHPLVGRRERDFACWDEATESHLFGTEPLFIFDPVDTRNAPDPTLHGSIVRSWSLYPDYIKDLFVQAFTTGLNDPVNGRVRESVWRASMARLLDSIQRCNGCGRENFFIVNSAVRRCWLCERELDTPLTLVVRPSRIVVTEGAKIYKHHVGRDYDLDSIIGEVLPNPRRPDILGLRNRTETTWWGWLPNGTSQVVDPGRSIRIEPGLRVDLGDGTNVLVEG